MKTSSKGHYLRHLNIVKILYYNIYSIATTRKLYTETSFLRFKLMFSMLLDIKIYEELHIFRVFMEMIWYC